jgi:hypothetical protein
MWEAFWYDMRRGLSPVSANCGALVVISMVCAVPFFTEVGVLKSMDVGDMDTLLGFELMEAVHGKRGVADEVRSFDWDGRSVLVSVYFVGVQGGLVYSPTSCLWWFQSLTCVKVQWP